AGNPCGGYCSNYGCRSKVQAETRPTNRPDKGSAMLPTSTERLPLPHRGTPERIEPTMAPTTLPPEESLWAAIPEARPASIERPPHRAAQPSEPPHPLPA